MAETKRSREPLGGRSRVSGDVHARFWESPGVRFPRATHRVPSKAVYEMRDRPLAAGLQDQAANHPELPWSRARVVSVKEKARNTCQVWIGKTSASEPLMKRRKPKVMSKPGSTGCSGISAGETCLLPARHPAFRRRESDFRLVHGTWEPVVSMLREKSKWSPHKDLSTDARHRDGTARTSDEGRVMRLERRGRVTRVSPRGSTAQAGGTRG